MKDTLLSLLLLVALLLGACEENSNATTTETTTEKTTVETPIPPTKEEEWDVATDDPEIDPVATLEAYALADLQSTTHQGLEFDGQPESLNAVFYDLDKDGDKDLLVQVFLKNNLETKDAFVVFESFVAPEEGMGPEAEPMPIGPINYTILTSAAIPCQNCQLKGIKNNQLVFEDAEGNRMAMDAKKDSSGDSYTWVKL